MEKYSIEWFLFVIVCALVATVAGNRLVQNHDAAVAEDKGADKFRWPTFALLFCTVICIYDAVSALASGFTVTVQ